METAPNPQSLILHQNGNPPQLVPMPYLQEFQDPDEEELDLGQLFAVIRRRAFVILGVASVVTAGVWFWTSNQTREYQGKFQILVEPVTTENDKFSQLSSMAGGLGASFFPGGQGGGLDYESQLAVLQSRKLMDPLVQQLQSRYPEIEYKSLLAGDEAPLSLERFNKTTKIVEVRYRDSEPEKIQFVLETLKDGFLRYSLEDRKSNIGQGIQFIEDQLPQLRQRVDSLQEQLQKFRQQYNLIEPELQAEQLAQQLTKIDDQLLDAQAQLVQQQQLYETLRRQVGLEPGTAIAASVLSEAPTYQARLNRLKELENEIAAESTRFKPTAPQLQVLLEERQKLEFLLGQEAGEVLGSELPGATGNPKAPFQNSVRTELIQEMVKAASQIQVLQVRNQVLGEAAKMLGEYREQFPIVLRQYTDLQRELQVATTTLNELLARREGLRVDAAQKEIPWEVISQPEIPRDADGNPVPVSPNLPRNLVLGAMLGLMLGFGAALLVERLDNVFHSPDEIKDATRLPILGLIPASDSAVYLPPMDMQGGAEFDASKDFAFVEAFRALNANIRFLNPNKAIRSVAIASATPAEGKSTVAVNLAEAAAAMGQRVLLVDADLRWPQVHKRLGLPNGKGLTHAIATEMDINEAIAQSPLEPNLFVLTAGAIPPDPIRLLSSEKMHALMQQLHSSFDLVIYDTPPLLGVVDGRVIAGYTDGVGLVVSVGQTERPAIQQAIANLQSANMTVLGIIANGVQGDSNAWYYDDRRYSRSDREPEPLEEENAISL